jgi:hypothetical protein
MVEQLLIGADMLNGVYHALKAHKPGSTHNMLRHPDRRLNRTAYPSHVPEKILWTPQNAAAMEFNLFAGWNVVSGLDGIFQRP